MAGSLSFDVLLSAAALAVAYALFVRRRLPAPLPPGPKPKPVIGNWADLPPPGVHEWVHWGKHKDLYGPISSVTVFGTTLVIINDLSIATELLDKQSAVYSDRPHLPFVDDLVGFRSTIVALQLGDDLRQQRKLIHTVVGTKGALSKLHPIMEVEVKRFCFRLLRNPKKLSRHIRTEAGALILKATYGYNVGLENEDPLLTLVERVIVQYVSAASPGTWLVDQFPILKYVPSWLPGAKFKRVAARHHHDLMSAVNRPYEFVKRRVETQSAPPSFLQTHLEMQEEAPARDENDLLKWTAFALYAAGADTSMWTVTLFFLLMVLHPDVQRKAQEELDRVVDSDRFPTFSDRENLPYIDAIVKEVFRFHPVLSMGVPHAAKQDGIYNGYFIPKGSLLFANLHGFCHDPTVFKDPMTFSPDRFLGTNPETDPRTLMFGFGRRICPGRELADTSVFLTIAMSLAAFNISTPVVDGKVVEPQLKIKPGIISNIEPFEVDIRPRSEKAEAMVRAVEVEHPFDDVDAQEIQSIKV